MNNRQTAAPKRVRSGDNEYILRSRIKGERTIAAVRLVTLAIVFLFAMFVFVARASEIGVFLALTDFTFITNMFSTGTAVLVSVWVLRITKKNRYFNWMKTVLPLIDITLLNAVCFANASYNNVILLITGAPVFFYFVFLIITVFRNSVSSVIVTGVYASVSYVALSFYSQTVLKILDKNGSLFTNVYGLKLTIMQDDEVLKGLVFLLITGICALLSKRFNQMVIDQTGLQVERENIRSELSNHLREITQSILKTSESLNRTSEKLSDAVGEFLEGNSMIERETKSEFEKIESSSASVIEMIRSVDSVASSIERQADFVAESRSLIEGLSRSILSTRDASRKASEISAGLLTAAETGGRNLREVAGAVSETEISSGKIEEVLNIISSIADRTNLLAMNAAIEAAHAGESGKGFAIVAQEIRNLAEQSATHVDRINEFVKDIREKVSKIVVSSRKADESFNSILDDTRRTTGTNRDVLEMMEKESSDTQNVMKKIENLSMISQELKIAGQEQASGGKDILESITTMKEKADNVYALTGKQTEKSTELDHLKTELMDVIARNQEIMGKLEKLVEKF